MFIFIFFQVVKYQWWVSAANASTHIAIIAVDRAVCISYPTWHYKKSWNTLSLKISLSVSLFNYFILSPQLIFYKLKDERCDLVFWSETILKLYIIVLLTGFSVFGNMLITFISNTIFISKLKQLRKKKSEKGASRKHPRPAINEPNSNENNETNGGTEKTFSEKNKYLTPEDLAAIKTMQLVCYSYLICNGCAIATYVIHSKLENTILGESHILRNVARLFATANYSLNFFFYLRGKTFRSTFKSRWKPIFCS